MINLYYKLSNFISKQQQVPSYFVENLLYNVSDYCYDEPSISTRVYKVLEWLHDNRDSMSQFICQNEQIYLFGNSQEQWREDDARTFVNQVITLWNEW